MPRAFFTDLMTMKKLLLLPLILLAGCSFEGLEITSSEPTVPEPPVVVVEPSPEAKVALAELAAFREKVTFRREKEMNWQDAVVKLPFFRFDAIHTHDKATAQVSFKNGSVVDMTPESMLIINPSGDVTWDRLLLRKGNLTAQTQKELWILTTAAMVRMRPSKSQKFAKSNLKIEEGKNLSVVLQEGEGMMLQTEQPGRLDTAKPVKLVVNKPVVIAAPAVGNDFGLSEQEVTWPTAEKVDEQERNIASLPPSGKPTPVDFVITSPADYSEVKTSSVTLKGRVKGEGATSLLINGKTITLGAKQDFAVNVALNRGANAILVQLNRNEGTPVFRRWTVIRR